MGVSHLYHVTVQYITTYSNILGYLIQGFSIFFHTRQLSTYTLAKQDIMF